MFRALLVGLFATGVVLTAPEVTPDPVPTEWNKAGKGKTYVLYRRHDVKAMNQGAVGSCVGAATAKGLELLHGIKFSAEFAYGMSRKHFGFHTSPYGGSFVKWSMQTLKDIGALPSLNYAIFGEDLREYSYRTAKKWERGPPEEMELMAQGYRTGFVKITTWEEFRGAIATGHPVVVGSNVGFGKAGNCVRSSSGVLRSQWWSKWNHAMVFAGVSDGKSKRALLLNSWGEDWISGPKWLGDEPGGSFWILKDDVMKMMAQGDMFAILPIEGLPR